jgi:hypothetical protein
MDFASLRQHATRCHPSYYIPHGFCVSMSHLISHLQCMHNLCALYPPPPPLKKPSRDNKCELYSKRPHMACGNRMSCLLPTHHPHTSVRAAATRPIQYLAGWSDGSSRLYTKLVLWPVVESNPSPMHSLVSRACVIGCTWQLIALCDGL